MVVTARGNSQRKGPEAGVCLAGLRNMSEEADVAGTNKEASGRRGTWRDDGGLVHRRVYSTL